MEKVLSNGSVKVGRSLFEEVFKTYGVDAQKYLFFEEVGELMKAIARYERASGISNLELRKQDIASEIADVSIMLSQLKMIYHIPELQVNSFVESRLAKMDYELQQKIYNVDRKCEFAYCL